VVLRVELPGIDAERDLDLAIRRSRLVLSGRREPAVQDEAATGRVTLSEIRHGAFRRTFVLPDHVTGDDVEASYDRGILAIRIRNVVPPPPQPRRIAVTSSQ
jgi:HSP20 family protein